MFWTKLFFALVFLFAVTTINASHRSRLRLVGCHTGSDCGEDTCCQEKEAALYIHKGRFRRRLPFSLRRYPGICIPMGKTQWPCHVHAGVAWSKPKGLVQLCPCTSICGAIGRYDKYGQQGVCTWGK